MATYIQADDIKERARLIADRFMFGHIDFNRVHCYRYTSKTKTVAKIIGFFKTLQLVHPEIQPYYVVVFNEYNFLKQSREEQDTTILHELLHIPKTFSGEYGKIAHHKIREMSKRAFRKIL
ncbi:MAG: putative metallopeptidase [Nanoarchaeota archaeon]